MAFSILFEGAANANGNFGQPIPEPPEGYLHEFRFNAGDTYAKNSNGMTFDGGTRTITAAPGGETGGRYYYAGSNNPAVDQTDEQWFDIPPISEFYMLRRIWVPPNYNLRLAMRVEFRTPAQVASWAVGDVLQGTDGAYFGTIEYIETDGNNYVQIYLLWPDHIDYYGTWVGTITNVTNGQTATSSTKERLDNGNKHFVIHCDGYSGNGKSPTLVFGWTSSVNGVVQLDCSVAVDGFGSGVQPNTHSSYVDFITADDLGKFINIMTYVKMATNEATHDGVVKVWKKTDGELSYAEKLVYTGINMGPRAAAVPPYSIFKRGYLMGYSNSGFKTNTTLIESELLISATPIDGVVA
ncbi:MAG TPA: hypothetical protein VN030_11510 [Cellvibrio sp.]|nr:hypothetical protein [Cellvibrio sp.]